MYVYVRVCVYVDVCVSVLSVFTFRANQPTAASKISAWMGSKAKAGKQVSRRQWSQSILSEEVGQQSRRESCGQLVGCRRETLRGWTWLTDKGRMSETRVGGSRQVEQTAVRKGPGIERRPRSY